MRAAEELEVREHEGRHRGDDQGQQPSMSVAMIIELRSSCQ